jgi:hypothetical protein
MDTTKTRTELIREAADKLGIVGTGQPLEFEYSDRLDRNIGPLFMQLAVDGICQIVNDQYIPGEWFDALAGLLANVCSPLGGKNYSPDIKKFYESELRRLTSSKPGFNVLELEFF